MKCIRCEQTVRIGATEQCPRNCAGLPHEGLAHEFVPGAFDGMCNYIDPDFGLRCGYGESEWEQDIDGAPVHNLRPEWRGYAAQQADIINKTGA